MKQTCSAKPHGALPYCQGVSSYFWLFALFLVLTLSQLSACFSPPSPTPVPPSSQFFNDAFQRYYHLVSNQQFPQAYAMLSPALRAQESYNDFVVNDNYTLKQDGSWQLTQIASSKRQPDGITWNVGVELTEEPSGFHNWITYYWNIHWRVLNGKPLIVAIGLYPTGIWSSP